MNTNEKLMDKIVNKLIGDMVGLFASEFQQIPSIVISTIGEKVLLDLAEENDKKLLSLLTSEVEKEREQLLKEVNKKVIGESEYVTKPIDPTDFAELIGRNKLRRQQRKALSDIGGKGVIRK